VLRPRVEVRREIAALARGQVDQPQRLIADALRDVDLVPDAGDPTTVR
jgi:hypothetical protein